MSFPGLRRPSTVPPALALVLSTTILVGAGARPVRHLRTSHNPDYIYALATANRFLYAWQSHDEESGVVLLTDAAKQSSSLNKVAAFFRSEPLASYEIGRGRRVKDGFYVFPLALYSSAGENDLRCRTRYFQLPVVKTGKQDWGIDTLP